MMAQLLSPLPSYCEGLGAGGEGPGIGTDIGVFSVFLGPVKLGLGSQVLVEVCA